MFFHAMNYTLSIYYRIWMYDLSFLKYALHFLTALEAKDEIYSCQPHQLIHVDPATYNQCPESVIRYIENGPMKCQFACGKELLNYFGVKYSASWEILNFGVLHAFMVFFMICNFLCVKYINHVKR